MKIYFVSLLILFCSFILLAQTLTKEDYAVYGVVLRDIYKEEIKYEKEFPTHKIKHEFVILDKTKIFESSETAFDETFSKLKVSEVSRNFAEKNNSSVSLQKSFPINYQYSLVNQNKINELLKRGKEEVEKERQKNQRIMGSCGEDVWQFFRKNYPGAEGYYQFSRVSFSSNKVFAYVSIQGEGGSWHSNQSYLLKK